MKLWLARRSLGRCAERKVRWDTDSVGNEELLVWGRDKSEATLVASKYWSFVQCQNVIVRRTRLPVNPTLQKAPSEAGVWVRPMDTRTLEPSLATKETP